MFDERRQPNDDSSFHPTADPAAVSPPDDVLAIGAECLAALGHFAEARMQVEAALRVNPQNEKALALAVAISEAQLAPLIGEAAKRFLSNHLDEAEQLLRRALAIEAEHDQATRMLASVLSRRQMQASPSSAPAEPIPANPLPEPIPGSSIAAFPTPPATRRQADPASFEGRSRRQTLTVEPPAAKVAASGAAQRIDRPLLAGVTALGAALVAAIWLAPRAASDPPATEPTPTPPAVAASALGSPAERAEPSATGPTEVPATPGPTTTAATAASSPRPEVIGRGDRTVETARRSVGKDAAPPAAPAAAERTRPVAETLTAARAQLAAGDWETALASALKAAELSPGAPAVETLAREILEAARSTASAARLQAGSVGASAETRFFSNAAELVTLGDQRADESFLLAARSYFVAADLFGRSGEQAQLKGMRRALDAYVGAYEVRDIERLRDVWPSLSGQSLVDATRALRSAKSIAVTIDRCSMSLQEPLGAATCRVVQSYDPKRGRKRSTTETVSFRLRRSGSDWRIENVQGTS